MADYMKDKEFETVCKTLFSKGSRLTDEKLFNGQFYVQRIQPTERRYIANGLIAGMGTRDFSHPDFQIGEGCLVDQLAGQDLAHICGLGNLADSSHLKKTMQSIWKYNYVKAFNDQFNNMRTYGLGAESGLVLVAYPEGTSKPEIPLSYCSEAWSGLEYTAAAEMLYQGMTKEALTVITNVRNRYDGSKRNPFNEQECGNHYARAMASWGLIIAYSQFNYSAVEKKFCISSVPGNYFWSNGYSWGNAQVGKEGKLVISVHSGELELSSIELRNAGSLRLKEMQILREGDSREFAIR
jgi:non-lysosomal glucosylceramidase